MMRRSRRVEDVEADASAPTWCDVEVLVDFDEEERARVRSIMNHPAFGPGRARGGR